MELTREMIEDTIAENWQPFFLTYEIKEIRGGYVVHFVHTNRSLVKYHTTIKALIKNFKDLENFKQKLKSLRK